MQAYWIPIIMLWVIIFMQGQNQKKAVAQIVCRRHRKDNKKMNEIAKQFIGKECLIYTFNSTQLNGTVKEVVDGALLLEDTNGTVEAVNLDFVTRIREYPRKKNGKKKSVVLD